MLLQLAGVSVDEIVEDYLEGVRGANAHLLAVPAREPGRSPEDLAEWEEHVTKALRTFLRETDAARYLVDHGLAPTRLERIRHRLLA